MSFKATTYEAITIFLYSLHIYHHFIQLICSFVRGKEESGRN